MSIISRDYEFRAEHYRVVRNSGLPRHTFKPKRSPDAIVFWFSAAAIVIALVAVRFY